MGMSWHVKVLFRFLVFVQTKEIVRAFLYSYCILYYTYAQHKCFFRVSGDTMWLNATHMLQKGAQD